jgi:hypothetical protein
MNDVDIIPAYVDRLSCSQRGSSLVAIFLIYFMSSGSPNVSVSISLCSWWHHGRSISPFIEDAFQLDFHILPFGIAYHPQHPCVVCVAYHHSGHLFEAKLELVALSFRCESSGLTSKLRYIVERGFIQCLEVSINLHWFPQSAHNNIWCQ